MEREMETIDLLTLDKVLVQLSIKFGHVFFMVTDGLDSPYGRYSFNRFVEETGNMILIYNNRELHFSSVDELNAWMNMFLTNHPTAGGGGG